MLIIRVGKIKSMILVVAKISIFFNFFATQLDIFPLSFATFIVASKKAVAATRCGCCLHRDHRTAQSTMQTLVPVRILVYWGRGSLAFSRSLEVLHGSVPIRPLQDSFGTFLHFCSQTACILVSSNSPLL